VTLCSFHHGQVHEGGFETSLSKDMEVRVWTPRGRLHAAPLWDGERVDYEACVDALLVN